VNQQIPINNICKAFLALSLAFSHTIKSESNSPPQSITVSNPQQLGQQLVIELYGCNPKTIENIEKVEEIMTAGVHAAHATIVQKVFHKFTPVGVSGVLVLSESHMTIHTWPEFGYCAVDLYTCGSHCNNDAALDVLKEKFEATSARVIPLKRGIFQATE